MQRDVEKVEEIYRAFGKRDLQAIIMLMANDVEIRQSAELPWGGCYRGHDGVNSFLAQLSENLENRLTLEGVIDAGEQVVVSGRTSGKARSTGLEFDIPFVHVWTVQEGLITRFEPYIDNATMLVALGL
jgi:ketosteroid isomerase-like protein